MSGDVVVVTQKIVSKAEGRIGRSTRRTPAAVALAEKEAVRLSRRRGELLITETSHGFVCANSGVDHSNIAEGYAALLPVDPDRSARRIRAGIRASDRRRRRSRGLGHVRAPWRNGVTDVAIGSAGIRPIVDLRGTVDVFGRPLVATEICVVDEIASAAELVMGKAASVPVALVRGVDPAWLGEGSVAADVVRSYGEDLFR